MPTQGHDTSTNLLERNWPKIIFVWMAIGTAALITGVVAAKGYVVIRNHFEGRRANAELETYLRSTISGIEVGMPFPNLLVSPTDGGPVKELRAILPAGGVVLYLQGGCGSCKALLEKLGHKPRGFRNAASRAVVIVDGDAEAVQSVAAFSGTALPVYQDIERAMAREYRVLAFPAYFVLDSTHSVQALGTAYLDDAALFRNLELLDQ